MDYNCYLQCNNERHNCLFVEAQLSWFQSFRLIYLWWLGFSWIPCPGLDPARPLIEKHASNRFRLTKDDAKVVQIIHTNAGFLGQSAFTGTIDFCVNGGQTQPYCTGNSISKFCVIRFWRLYNAMTSNPSERARCSHFLSVCYLANAVLSGEPTIAFQCPTGCVRNNRIPFAPLRYSNRIRGRMKHYHIGQDTPDEWVLMNNFGFFWMRHWY